MKLPEIMFIAGDAVAYLERTVRQSGVLATGARLLLGVSGGQDSTAMALALAALREELGLGCEVAHVNHGLRGEESDADEEFVVGLSADLDMPLHVRRVTVPGGDGRAARGWEEAARVARLLALREVAESIGASSTALAHTATDRAETVLMNVLRGSGLDGLAAMRSRSGDIVRPMLRLTRPETASYCAAKGVTPRRDRTNEDQSILRNRVRLSLIPLLERDYRPGASEALVRLAEIAEAEVDWTQPVVEEACGDLLKSAGEWVCLGLGALAALPAGLRLRVLREAVRRVRGDLRDIGWAHLESLGNLVTGGETGKRAELPGLRAERTAHDLRLRTDNGEEGRAFQASLKVPGSVCIAEAGVTLSSRVVSAAACDPGCRGPMRAHLDVAAVGGELVVRSPRAGDRMVPLGVVGTKKLQDILVDRRVPRGDRARVPVVVARSGEIVWLVGHCISDGAKVTPTTSEVAELTARASA